MEDFVMETYEETALLFGICAGLLILYALIVSLGIAMVMTGYFILQRTAPDANAATTIELATIGAIVASAPAIISSFIIWRLVQHTLLRVSFIYFLQLLILALYGALSGSIGSGLIRHAHPSNQVTISVGKAASFGILGGTLLGITVVFPIFLIHTLKIRI